MRTSLSLGLSEISVVHGDVANVGDISPSNVAVAHERGGLLVHGRSQ